MINGARGAYLDVSDHHGDGEDAGDGEDGGGEEILNVFRPGHDNFSLFFGGRMTTPFDTRLCCCGVLAISGTPRDSQKRFFRFQSSNAMQLPETLLHFEENA